MKLSKLELSMIEESLRVTCKNYRETLGNSNVYYKTLPNNIRMDIEQILLDAINDTEILIDKIHNILESCDLELGADDLDGIVDLIIDNPAVYIDNIGSVIAYYWTHK